MSPSPALSRSTPLLLDTHVLVWALEEGPRLGAAAKRLLNQSARINRLLVSAITPWEIAMLVSKGRLQLSANVMQWIGEALSRPGVALVPLDPEIAVASAQLPFEMHADPADRILVATARHRGATLVTADRALLDLAAHHHIRALDAER